ncbi:uncharacterized protein LOC135273130 isoform X1 [Aotus nancymaae]|uniref:uncharacterized protein LOC135271092 isoform X1 n=1 Tax=Aotus nancymaae TaxID=37293 RepID=UPI0030FE35F4
MPACGTYTCRLPSCWTALEKNLHFVHMVYTMALVEDTLPEISEWLERHPREVVILACRIFQGLSEDLHDYLISCIKTIFGEMLCPRGVSDEGEGWPQVSPRAGGSSPSPCICLPGTPGCGCCRDPCSRWSLEQQQLPALLQADLELGVAPSENCFL